MIAQGTAMSIHLNDEMKRVGGGESHARAGGKVEVSYLGPKGSGGP